MKRNATISMILILSALLLLFSFTVSADTESPEVSTEPEVQEPVTDIRTLANAYSVYCVDTETMLISSKGDTACPASASVKLMSALVACEIIQDMSQTVEITSDMLKGTSGNVYGFTAGMSVTYDELIKTLLIRNANDSALVLASTLADSRAAYLELMNKKAEALGMSGTSYVDVTGIDPASTTTVNDMIILLSEVLKNDGVLSASGTRNTRLESTGVTIYSRNYFLSDYYNGTGTSYVNRSVIGGISGHSADLGDTLLSISVNGSYTYLTAVSGARRTDSVYNAYLITEDLLDYSAKSFAYRTLLSDARAICDIPVDMGNGYDRVTVFPARSVTRYIDKSTDIESTVSFDYTVDTEKLTAPVTFGQKVGVLRLYFEGELIEEIDLITRADIASSSSDYLMSEIIEFIQSKLFLYIVIAVSAVCIVYVLAVSIYRGQKQRKQRATENTEGNE